MMVIPIGYFIMNASLTIRCPVLTGVSGQPTPRAAKFANNVV